LARLWHSAAEWPTLVLGGLSITKGLEMAAKDLKETRDELVNPTAKQLTDWIQTDESKRVGQKRNGGESVGYQMGREIVTLLGRKQAELDEEDYAHMRKVTGYIKRHLAQRPDGDVTDSPWRWNLMNWGHDPLKH
jgi:hypothetical protein